MNNKVNIFKITASLTPKERAKIMVLNFDEEFRTGVGTLSRVEKNTLRTLKNGKECKEYGFYYDIQRIILPLFSSGIESSTLRFIVGFYVFENAIRESDEKKISLLKSAMRNNFNLIHSYLEAANRIEEKYDFPVLGGYYRERIGENLEHLDLFVKLSNIAFLSYRQSLGKNMECEEQFIGAPKIDREIIEGWLEVVGKMAEGVVFE